MTRSGPAGICLTALLLAACSGDPGTHLSLPSGDGRFTPIGEIQGSSAASPLVGRSVTVTGIVSGDFQDYDADPDSSLDGFFLQSASPDSDPATSDGIFIDEGGRAPGDVAVGDRVTVAGVVTEHAGETRIAASSVTVTGTGRVAPVDVVLPSNLEQVEGMLVRFPQPLTVTDLYELERFGSVRLIAGERPFAFTNVYPPAAAVASAHNADIEARTIRLDDGRRAENVQPIRFLETVRSAGSSLRIGDAVTGLTGNLRFAAGSEAPGKESFRLIPAAPPGFVSRNPRPGPPVHVGGAVRVVGFNTLNYFSTVDTGRDNCGPAGSGGCRGADSDSELERQLAKLVTALSMLDADVVGLIEIENNGGIALQTVVDRLNASGRHLYDHVDSGIVGVDVIAVGFLYRPSSVSLVGGPAVLDADADRRFDDRLNRPVLAQAFEQASTGAVFSVALAHLKSKGSSCAESGDPDRLDGQGNCNRTRTRAAAAIADWIHTDPTNSGDDDYLLIGDLNAYLFEDPLAILEKAGLHNLIKSANGSRAWSFVYDGQAGALDHAFATPSLLPQVVAADEWHINADEAPALDYNTEFGRDPALFDADSPYRVSDHDPIVVGLNPAP